MTIELLTTDEHETLKYIYENYPSLTLQNKGYEYINKSKLSEYERSKMNIVTDILKKNVRGFNEFSNFRLTANNEIQIRLQYNWNHGSSRALPFTGVGYVLLDELLNGFNTTDKKEENE